MGNNKLTVKVVNVTATLFVSTSVLLWNLDNPMKYWLMQRKCNSKHYKYNLNHSSNGHIQNRRPASCCFFMILFSPPPLPPVTFHSLRLSKPFPSLFNVRFRTMSILADLLTIKCLCKFPLKAPSPWKHSTLTRSRSQCPPVRKSFQLLYFFVAVKIHGIRSDFPFLFVLVDSITCLPGLLIPEENIRWVTAVCY